MRRFVALVCALLLSVTMAPLASASGGGLFYRAHVQNIGDTATAFSAATAGTTGQSLRMEALSVWGAPVEYRTHVQDIGWGPWVAEGWAGTAGRSLRAEAVQVRPRAGVMDSAWRVECRAHVQDVGWLPWVADGATCGTTGRSLRLEAVQLRIVAR